MKYVLLTLLLSSCSSMDGLRCFSLDGKKSSWCKRKIRAERVCASNKGMKSFYFNFAECYDGKVFKNIN